MSLVFRTCEMDDTGTYSCEILEFVKNGEKDQTDCWLQVEGGYLGGLLDHKVFEITIS